MNSFRNTARQIAGLTPYLCSYTLDGARHSIVVHTTCEAEAVATHKWLRDFRVDGLYISAVNSGALKGT